MFTGIAIRLFFGGLIKKIAAVLGFCIDHWKIVVPVAIAAFVLWQWYSAEQDLKKVTREYELHLAADETAGKVREAENAAKDLRMKESVSEIRIESAKQLATLEKNYDALQTQKTATDRDAADLRDELRGKLEAANATPRLPSLSDRPQWPAEGGGDGDPADPGQDAQAYTQTLETACAVTTLDYNDLYQRCKTANKIYGKPK